MYYDQSRMLPGLLLVLPSLSALPDALRPCFSQCHEPLYSWLFLIRAHGIQQRMHTQVFPSGAAA
jgi:hypothetical protein